MHALPYLIEDKKADKTYGCLLIAHSKGSKLKEAKYRVNRWFLMVSVKLSQSNYDKIFTPTYEGKRLHVFISYSSTDKVYAGELKDFLQIYGLSVFLAHEDIRPTLDWKEEIIRNLRLCDIFIPIISSDFSLSEWTDQETGIAFGLEKFIIPIRMGKDPYGFIGKLQGCKGDSYFNVLTAISDNSSLKKSLIDCLLRSLEKVPHFDDASIIVKELEKYSELTRTQTNEVIRIAIKNDQFRLCWNGKKFLKLFSKEHSEKINPMLMRVFDKVKNDFSTVYPDSV